MKRTLITNLALILLFALAFWLYRQHKNVQKEELRQSMLPELVSELGKEQLKIRQYTGINTKLWADRDYHTEQTISRLSSLRFVLRARNSTVPYALRSNRTTVLYLLANENDTVSTKGWQRVEEEVLVEDVVPERRLNALFMKQFTPGLMVVTPAPGGPCLPVFFEASVVKPLSSFSSLDQ